MSRYRIAPDDEFTIAAGPTFDGRLASALRLVAAERTSQVAKWGQQRHDPLYWLAILTEETGEVAKEVADGRIQPFDREAYRAELVQVAAVAVAAIESLDAMEGA